MLNPLATAEEVAARRARNKKVLREVEDGNAEMVRDRRREHDDMVDDSARYVHDQVSREANGEVTRHSAEDVVRSYVRASGVDVEPPPKSGGTKFFFMPDFGKKG